jgi:hypothetical protein
MPSAASNSLGADHELIELLPLTDLLLWITLASGALDDGAEDGLTGRPKTLRSLRTKLVLARRQAERLTLTTDRPDNLRAHSGSWLTSVTAFTVDLRRMRRSHFGSFLAPTVAALTISARAIAAADLSALRLAVLAARPSSTVCTPTLLRHQRFPNGPPPTSTSVVRISSLAPRPGLETQGWGRSPC